MDINYNALFGVEEPAEESTTDTTAESAEQTQPTEQPTEQPAEQSTDPEAKTAEPTEQAREEQSREERSRQAMARRIREAEDRAAKAERAKVSELLSRLNLDDPGSGEKVDTIEKLEAYERKLSDQRMQAGAPTESDIGRIVRDEREKASQPKGITPEQRAELDREIQQIGKMDPAMTDINAILQSDIGQAFRGFVGAGDDFVTAFYKARTQQAQIPEKAAAAAKAKAAGKEHLSKTQSLGTEEIPVPKEDLAIFREFLPTASEAEIRKYYNQDRKRYGPK